MRLLRLVGPGEDGTSVVVEAVEPGSLEGERFELSLDDRLRALATAEPVTSAGSAWQAEPPAVSSGSAPTPREIQMRVRAGETAQAVADEAGIPLDRVMRFAYPVLHERVRVTDEARRARARRGGDGLLAPFGELIDSRLTRHGVDPATVRWDAYRREDGGWTVTAEFSAYERAVLAKFSFTLLNRTVSALDDVAADLLSDRPVQALLPPPAPEPEPVAEAPSGDWAPEWDAAPAPPRLTAVPNPRRAEAPRAQEASPAVRPPSRRQKAHTRPVAVDADDELFDQDAFEQPWHEPPLPLELGGSRPGSPRHRARQPADERPDAVALAHPDIAEAAGPEWTGADGAQRHEPAGVEPIDLTVAELTVTEFTVADLTVAGFAPAGSAPEGAEAAPVRSAEVRSAEVRSAEVRSAEVRSDGGSAGADSRPVEATPPGDLQSKRGRRSGDKPRMPSWDDILLGVRHKSD